MADPSIPRLSKDSLDQLEDFGYCVVPQFCATDDVRNDLLSLREAGRFSVAKIGHDGQIQDASTPFRDIRHSETCSLWDKDHVDLSLPESPTRHHMLELLQQLKADLSQNEDESSSVLDPCIQEVMYAYYPEGGYYRRHVDAEIDTTSTFRTYSFLLYLSSYSSDTAGGCLRLHMDSGTDQLPPNELPHFLDVPPEAGTLVVFRSDQVPHEVMTTFAPERLALVGWFWAQDGTTKQKTRSLFPHDKVVIQEKTIAALRDLRDRVPSLRTKLEPQVEYQSGLLHDVNDAWGIVMPPAERPKDETSPRSDDDTNPLYWSKVAKFGIDGSLVTLSLGGVRLRKIQDLESSLVPLMGSLTVLDVSNTDIDPVCMAALLEPARSLKHFYCGGNAWPDADSVRCVAVAIPNTVEVVDCRYSNWTAEHLAFFVFADENHALGRFQKLYLEGNPLGDEAIEPLSKALDQQSRLRELFLGQCLIGSTGAATLASTSCGSLRKLYLEGNQIGAEGAQALLDSKLIGTLEKLYLDNNAIPKELSLKLGHALASPTMIGDGAFYQDS